MKIRVKILTNSFAVLLILIPIITIATAESTQNKVNFNHFEPEKIMAVNDTLYFVSGCGNLSFGGNVIDNDIIPEGTAAKIQYIVSTEKHFISFGSHGNFAYLTQIGFNGIVSFNYQLCDENDRSYSTEATVYIHVQSDNDCDGTFDTEDIDDDNDGIPDLAEGNGEIDTDVDGIADSFDIDSDNDGIPDIREWQTEKNYLMPSGIDTNINGWDDVFEDKLNAHKFETIDSDNDGIPDYLDEDSDNDGISDFIEATDVDFDSLADYSFRYSDSDNDGLDDAFDIVRYWLEAFNSIGSSVPIPDHNINGIADFREKSGSINNDDENSELLAYKSSKITFPNPTSGLFSVSIHDYSNDMETHIKIYGLNGDLKADIIPTHSIVDLDLTSFNSGVYVIKIITPELSCTKKLVLQN